MDRNRLIASSSRPNVFTSRVIQMTVGRSWSRWRTGLRRRVINRRDVVEGRSDGTPLVGEQRSGNPQPREIAKFGPKVRPTGVF